MLGLRPPGLEFRILCLKDSVISIILPSSRGFPGPVWPICAQRWPKARFISFIPRPYIYRLKIATIASEYSIIQVDGE